MRLLTVRTCNFGVNTRLVHRTGIKGSFFWAFVHNLSFFTSLLSQPRVMNQVCTALIFSPWRVANNEQKRCISPPILNSYLANLAPRHFIRNPLAKTIELRLHLPPSPFYAVPSNAVQPSRHCFRCLKNNIYDFRFLYLIDRRRYYILILSVLFDLDDLIVFNKR